MGVVQVSVPHVGLEGWGNIKFAGLALEVGAGVQEAVVAFDEKGVEHELVIVC